MSRIDPLTPQLFGLERSVYTRIVRIVLEEKRAPYTLHEVEIFGPDGVPGEHLERHPFGRIPVFEHGELRLYETGAITRYADESFPGPPLQPRDPRQRARMNQLISILDCYAYRPMVWGVFLHRVSLPLAGEKGDEDRIASALQSTVTCLTALHRLLGSNPFMAGERVSLADAHAFPIFRYFCLAPEGFALLQEYPELLQWYGRIRSRASALQTVTSYEQAQ